MDSESEGFALIEVTGLTKTYGEITALKDVSFKVETGQIVGFLGANGAGKTTTMDILTGCIGAEHGSVKVCGIDVSEEPEKAKAHLGYLPDEPPLYMDMKVEDYIRYAAQLRRVPTVEISRRLEDTIEKLSLASVRGRLVGNLSKGYKQRVGLAQAIVHNPDVLILDEPTEGLDPNQIILIRDLIRSLAGDHTILLSSHILSEVQNTCDHIIIIHQGQVVQQGTTEQIVRSAESGGHYQVEVGKDAQGLVGALAALPMVTKAEVEPGQDNRLLIHVTDDTKTVDELASVIVSSGHGLREIAYSKRSLEDVFIKLTH